MDLKHEPFLRAAFGQPFLLPEIPDASRSSGRFAAWQGKLIDYSSIFHKFVVQ